jgi:hypothetical protein
MKLNNGKNSYSHDDDVTMDELIEAYMVKRSVRNGNLSSSYQKALNCRIKRHIKPFFKGIEVSQISGSHIIRYVATRLKMWEDKNQSRRVAKLVVAHEFKAIKSIIHWGVLSGIIKENPILEIILPSIN